MKYLVRQEKKRRAIYKKNELQYLLLKSMVVNKYIEEGLKLSILKKVEKMGRSGISRVQNRCIITGRSAGIVRDYKVSRLTFKKLAEQGKLNGVKKG